MRTASCNKCGETSPDKFYPSLTSCCIECHRRRCADYNKRNREGLALKQRAVVLRKTYGITVEDYDRMFAEQGGVCALCRRPEPDRRRKYLSVDHCHRNGNVRALLCSRCNKGLGHFLDDPVLLRLAADYLESA